MLLAPLARKAGGWGIQKRGANGKPAGEMVEIFQDTNDPDYRAILNFIETGRLCLGQNKRWDMPGFKPHPFYIRAMKRYGTLPETFDPARDEVDVFQIVPYQPHPPNPRRCYCPPSAWGCRRNGAGDDSVRFHAPFFGAIHRRRSPAVTRVGHIDNSAHEGVGLTRAAAETVSACRLVLQAVVLTIGRSAVRPDELA